MTKAIVTQSQEKKLTYGTNCMIFGYEMHFFSFFRLYAILNLSANEHDGQQYPCTKNAVREIY